MLNKFNLKVLDKHRDAAAAAKVVGALPQTQPLAVEHFAARPEPEAKPETISSIGAGMTIKGSITCDGVMKIYGRIEGELRATEVLVGDGAHVEGDVVAQELVVRGNVKGTIRAVRVKLQGAASVEGDVFHRSLTIEENALFEGTSKRVENPTEVKLAGDTAKPIPALVEPQPVVAPAPLASISPEPKVVNGGADNPLSQRTSF